MLYLDTEFRSELDLTEVGHYKYLRHHSTELLMCAWAFGNDPVKLWQKHKEPIPEELKQGLQDDLQIICAWNCGFERIAFQQHLKIDIPVYRFEDPMIRARYMSMPGSQDKVGKILDIENKKLLETAKNDDSIIQFFCAPLKIGGAVNLFGVEPTQYRDWNTHPREWERLCARCVVDVEGMREIVKRMSKFPLPDHEYEVFALNELINDRGIYTDQMLLQGCMTVVDKEFASLRKEFQQLTGIKNPKSPSQVLAYVKKHGYTFSSIGKPFVKRALSGECTLDEECKKALSLRLQLSKSSVSKLESCDAFREPDGRIRGLFNFFGAARTGRWTSGGPQVQNLIKSTKEVEKNFELAIRLLKAGNYEEIKKNFSSPIDVACSALRPLFRAPDRRKFVIADLSAIESRGAGWVSGCVPLMEVFRLGRDPYCAFAALMDPTRTYEDIYHEYKVLKKKDTRNNAKPPTLGCGYGLGPGVKRDEDGNIIIEYDEEGNVVNTGLMAYAKSMGVDLVPEYAEKAVEVFRSSYREIPQFWWDLDKAFVEVVEHEGVLEVGPLLIEKIGRVVAIWLPSGRALHYINPQVEYIEKKSKRTGRTFKAPIITIEGINQETHQWGRTTTRGPKLFENVVQAICRDILACGMLEAERRGFEIVLTCHDEIVAEVDEDSHLTYKELEEAMCVTPHWANGFLIGAEGFETQYYRKAD